MLLAIVKNGAIVDFATMKRHVQVGTVALRGWGVGEGEGFGCGHSEAHVSICRIAAMYVTSTKLLTSHPEATTT
jgi:hypothetical protein